MALSFPLSEYILTDDLTILLALVAITITLLHSLYKPLPLLHPILLGRQSDVGRVRLASESAVYRNYGTGLMGRFPLRPAKDVHVLLDLLKPDDDKPRTLWSTKITNTQLKNRVAAFSTGLAKLVPKQSNVFILLDDSLEFLIADLALASLSITSITLSSTSLIRPCLKAHPHAAVITSASFLPHLLDQTGDGRPIILTDLPPPDASGANVLSWAEIENGGGPASFPPVTGSSGDVFTMAYSTGSQGEVRGVSFTHENLTAGVAAVRAMILPTGGGASCEHVVSAFPLGTPFGRAVAYAALWEGAGVGASPGTEEGVGWWVEMPYPTVLFIRPGHLGALSRAVVEGSVGRNGVMHRFGWRQKLGSLIEGFVTRESVWDRWVFDGARERVMGAGARALRAVVVSGGPVETKVMVEARIALSVPVVNAYTDGLVMGPVLASHALDVQQFPTEVVAHVGPPGVNVEVKLVGVDDEKVEKGEDPVGVLVVRGPPVGKVLGCEGEWSDTGTKGSVRRNGTLIIK